MTVPYRVQANIKESAIVIIVATAREALAKMAELMESGHTKVVTRDLEGRIVANGALEAEATA